MKLLSVIKSVCLVIGFAVASDICAMQLVRYEKSAQQFINQFPSMTFARAYKEWNDLSLVAKQEIEQAEEKRNKGKANLIFGMIKFLPLEVCALIVSSCYDNQWNYDKDRKEFVSMASIKNIFCDMFVSNVPLIELKNSVYIKKLEKNNFIDDTFLRKLAGPIAILNSHRENNNEILTLNAVRSLNVIFSKICNQQKELYLPFPSSNPIIRLNFYNTYTLANSIFAFNEIFYDKSGKPTWDMFCMKILSPGIMASFLVRLVELNFCHKVINSTIVLKNEKRRVLNDMINKSDFAELLSDYLQPIENHTEYSIFSFLKIFCTWLLPFLNLVRQLNDSKNIPIFLGSFMFYIISIPLSVSIINDRVLLVGSVVCLSFMAVYIIIWTVVQMQQLKSETISWDKIPELLKKHDDGHIVIQ